MADLPPKHLENTWLSLLSKSTQAFIYHRQTLFDSTRFHDEMALGSDLYHMSKTRHFCDRPRKPRPLISKALISTTNCCFNHRVEPVLIVLKLTSGLVPLLANGYYICLKW